MQDISGFGTRLGLIATRTYPNGINIDAFADDADGLDIPTTQIGDKAMGMNGHMTFWSLANPKEVNINVIPGSEDDKNLRALLLANTPSRGKRPAGDVITLTIILPDGQSFQYKEGKIVGGPAAIAVAQSGKQKAGTYNFVFESVTTA